jgi:hypothetical protein
MLLRMALPNMVAENASQSSVARSNSGFPKYDITDPESSRFKIEIALSKHKERPHLSLLPAPVNPGGRAAQDLRDAFRQDMEIYRRQEEVGYARFWRQHIRVHQHLKWQCFITSRNWLQFHRSRDLEKNCWISWTQDSEENEFHFWRNVLESITLGKWATKRN